MYRLRNIRLPILGTNRNRFILLFRLIRGHNRLFIIPPTESFIRQGVRSTLLLLIRLSLCRLCLNMTLLRRRLRPLIATCSITNNPIPCSKLGVTRNLSTPNRLFMLLITQYRILPQIMIHQVRITRQRDSGFRLPFLLSPFQISLTRGG